jgi:hypothetical protein
MEDLTLGEIGMLLAMSFGVLFFWAIGWDGIGRIFQRLYRTFIDRGPVDHGRAGRLYDDDDDYVEPVAPWEYRNAPVRNGVPNAERSAVHAVPMQRTGYEQAGSAPNYSEQDIARILALIVADVRNYNGRPAQYGTSRAIEKALGLKRGAGTEYAAWSARVEAELARLNGQPAPPPGPITVNDPQGSYRLDRS